MKPAQKPPCTVTGCEFPQFATGLGLCEVRYARQRGCEVAEDYRPRELPGYKISHPLYQTWVAMRRRCSNPAATGFEYYGARGIRVCDRWQDSFAAFVADMGRRPPGMTLDRIDNDGNYEPGNCRWADASTQSR